MLKFNQLILRKFIFLFSILFIIIGAIIYYWTKEFYISQTKDALLNNIEIISFELKDKKELDQLAKKIKKNLNLRFTVISKDGVVIAESHKEKSKMDNHRNRVEILQADSEEFGYKIRHSHSINRDFLYIAKRYTLKNETLYIRLSKELSSINERILTLGAKIFTVLALFFMVLFFITYKISKEIEIETGKIVNFLTSLTKKNKNTYIDSQFSLEFYHITKLLTKVSQIIVKKEKQKSKYTNKLQIANQQKDDIISAISHEFKNPIAVINGYSQTLLEDEELNPNIRKKFLSKIYNNGLKLTNLIDTLRLSVKLDSGKQQINFMTLNLHDLIQEAVENIKINYPNREVEIQGKKNISIKGDDSLLSIVILNLVENAFKYSQENVTIVISKQKVEIVDYGIGISKKNLENITNKFYRVHENSWNNSLGLGLFIVNNIINLHNFKLLIESKEHEGSTFTIKF